MSTESVQNPPKDVQNHVQKRGNFSFKLVDQIEDDGPLGKGDGYVVG
jgi:hypothetical protein